MTSQHVAHEFRSDHIRDYIYRLYPCHLAVYRIYQSLGELSFQISWQLVVLTTEIDFSQINGINLANFEMEGHFESVLSKVIRRLMYDAS